MPPPSPSAPGLPPESRPGRPYAFLQHALALLGFLGLTLLYLRPAPGLLGTHLPAPEPVDPLLSVCIVKWGIHQIRAGMPDFLNAPFFFPEPGVIAYADHFFGTAAFAALFITAIPNVVAVYNHFLLGSFVLCGFTAWYVLRRCGLGAPAAFFGGCAFAFSSFRWDQIDHLHVLLTQWVPLLLWSFDRLLAAPGWRRAGVFLTFYVLHVSGGVYLAFMAGFPLLVLLLNRGPDLWRQRSRRTASIVLTAGALAAAVLLATSLPYLLRSGTRRFTRSESEVQAYGASLVSFVTPAQLNLYAGGWTAGGRRRENALFAGFLPTALAVAGAASGLRRLRRAPDSPLSSQQRISLGVLAAAAAGGYLLGEVATWAAFTGHPDLGSPGLYRLAACLLLAAPVALVLRHLWGGNWGLDVGALDPWERGLLLAGIACFFLAHMVLYLPLTSLVPGLAGMRVPARFYPFISFPLVWLAARTLDGWLRRAEPAGRRRIAAIAVTVFLLVELAPREVPWIPLPTESELPAVYHWLAGRGDVRAVLELPWRDQATEVAYIYAATLHWKPLVNGYSGFEPPRYIGLRRICCHPLPEGESLVRLRRWGVSHVLVHLGAMGREDREALFDWGRREGARREFSAGPDFVFRIAP